MCRHGTFLTAGWSPPRSTVPCTWPRRAGSPISYAITISGTPLLRFPSVVMRDDEALVVDQIRRALTPRRS